LSTDHLRDKWAAGSAESLAWPEGEGTDMRLYFMTEEERDRGTFLYYTCWISTSPTPRSNERLSVGGYNNLAKPAALGFPKPGNVRVLETGPCEEGA